MQTLAFALIGIPVGLALDAAVARLANGPAEDEDGDEAPATSPASIHAEAGSLVVAQEGNASWARRLAVVAATAALFAVAGARYADASDAAIIAAYVSALIVCAATDILSYRVPNAITYPAILGALLAGILMPEADAIETIAGGLLAGGLLLVPSLFTGGLGMGMGDVKLATFVGLALGITLVPPALLLMALGGGVVAAGLLVSGRRQRGQPIPYAPFISAGGLVTLLWYGSSFTTLS